jgi:hypothetical protein
MIGKLFSNGWKIRASFSNDWKKSFQWLENFNGQKLLCFCESTDEFDALYIPRVWRSGGNSAEKRTTQGPIAHRSDCEVSLRAAHAWQPQARKKLVEATGFSCEIL